jgi:hypothetical protein
MNKQLTIPGALCCALALAGCAQDYGARYGELSTGGYPVGAADTSAVSPYTFDASSPTRTTGFNGSDRLNSLSTGGNAQ